MSGTPNHSRNEPPGKQSRGVWAAIAISIGPIIGIAQDNLMLGIAGGVVIGLAIIIITSLKRSKTNKH